MINNKKSLVLKVLLGASLMSASYSNAASNVAEKKDPKDQASKASISLNNPEIRQIYDNLKKSKADSKLAQRFLALVDKMGKNLTIVEGVENPKEGISFKEAGELNSLVNLHKANQSISKYLNGKKLDSNQQKVLTDFESSQTKENEKKVKEMLASVLSKEDYQKLEKELEGILKISAEAAKKTDKVSTVTRKTDWSEYFDKDNIANKDEADKVLRALNSLTDEQGDTFEDQLDEGRKQVTTDSIEDLRNESQLITATLQERVDNFVGPFGLVSAPASGEEDPLNGVWINGFTGNNTDKRNVKTKSNFSGGSLGYERFVEDNTAVGLAVTAMRGDTKYGSSAKTKTNNLIASLYGMTNIDNLILSGSVYGGKGDSKTSRQIVQATGSLTANGKFKSNLYGALAGVAYQIEAEQNLITPSVSLQYSSITQKKYTETGAGNFNREIGKKTGEALVGTAAVKYGYVIENNGATIVPGVQVGVSSDFNAKSSNVKTKFLWENQAYDVKSDTKRQTRFFVTPSLVSKSDSFDIGLSYTFDQAKKAKGNLVTLKLLAKF